jgi:Bacterial extracellular solute-binding proteins, family 5 Middle
VRQPATRIGLLAFAMLAPLAHPALGPSYGGTLRVGVLDLPRSAAPRVPSGAGEQLLNGLVHETLLHLYGEALRPALASGWTAAADGREWRLTLRSATFHDGTTLLAGDVVRSLRRFLRSRSTAAAHLAEQLDGGVAFRGGSSEELPGLLAAEGVVRLRFHLAPPGALAALAALASPAAAITSAQGAGTGPFIPTLSTPGERFDLTAFSGHARGRPFLSRVQIRRFGTRAAVAEALNDGALDMGETGVPSSPAPATLLMRLDPNGPLFGRRGIRAAIAGSLDRERAAARSAAAAVATAGLFPLHPVSPGAPEPIPTRLLRGTATLAVARDVPPAASRLLVAHFAALGLRLEASPHPPGGMPEAPVQLRFWRPELPDPLLATRELLSLGPAPAAAHRALRRAALSGDPVERRLLLDEVADAVRAHAVLVPILVAPLSFDTGPGVHGVRQTPAGASLEDAWRETELHAEGPP